MKCAVVGGGAWGTALADLLASNGHDTSIWAFESDVVDSINRTHRNRFLRDAELSSSLRATGDLADALAGADLIVLATPSHHLRRIAALGRDSVADGAILTVASKGIERRT